MSQPIVVGCEYLRPGFCSIDCDLMKDLTVF